MARTHDDSAWTSGPAPLGYGDGDEATVIPSGSGQLKYSASYFRHAFVLTNAAAITGLTINLLRDDGAIVYLNGVPVLVENMPAGAVSYSTPATTTVGGTDETFYFPRVLSVLPLTNGVNVVAVEIHQVSTTSTDLSFDLELVAQVSEGSNPGTVTNPPLTNLLMGCLKREVYFDVPGNSLDMLTSWAAYPDSPDLVTLVNLFESPSNWGENFGERISGFLLPPVSGNYRFYVSGDDQCALFISADESPSQKVQVCFEPSWNPSRTWTGGMGRPNSENISAPLYLQAGRRYYVEALHKEGGGGDNFAVAWQLPNGPGPANGELPISGEFLATYPDDVLNHEPPAVALVRPFSGQVFTAPAALAIAADAQAAGVEFIANGTSLAVLTNPPFVFQWTNVPVGGYTLEARAWNWAGVSATSAPVAVLVQAGTPPNTTGERELHLIGIYEGVATSSGANPDGNAAVVVDRPGKRVTLVLNAFDRVTWNLSILSGSTIERVFLCGYHTQTVTGLPAGVPVVPQYYDNSPGNYIYYGYEMEVGLFLRNVPSIHSLTGLEISSFQGGYRAPYPIPFIINQVQDDPRLRSDYPPLTPSAELPNLAFSLSFLNEYSSSAGQVFARGYTLAGPTNGTSLLPSGNRVVTDDGGRFFYGISSHSVLKVDRQNGAMQTLSLGSDVPALSWPMGIAYDSQRHGIRLVSLGGEGFFYGYSPADNRWSVVSSMDNRDVCGLVYHPAQDLFYAVSTSGSSVSRLPFLYRLGPDGAFQGEITLPSLPYNLGFSGYRAELVSAGDYLVLLLSTDNSYMSLSPGDHRIYLIDPRTGQVWLTFRQTTSAVNQAPTVSLTAPTSGTVFDAGSPIPLTATASDPDGLVQSVTFLANGVIVGVDYSPPFSCVWASPAPGNYSLTAQAVDAQGASAVSTAVPISVQAISFVRRNLPAYYTPVVPFTVNLAASPVPMMSDYAVQEQPPAGWIPSNISHDGVYDPVRGVILFGPFADSEVRMLDYDITPSASATGNQDFSGTAISDGFAVAIAGDQRVAIHLLPPTIALSQPTNNDTFAAPAIIPLAVTLGSGGSPILWVEYYANNHWIGRATQAPYGFVWNNVSAGAYNLTAKVTDTARLTALSLPVNITVSTPINLPPAVSLIQPLTGTGFTNPVNIELIADAYDSDGVITLVEFFAGTNRLGFWTTAAGQSPENAPRARWIWTNAPVGVYSLTARASDAQQASTVSDPVTIEVSLPSSLPGITVVATDRLAVEATNDYGAFTVTRSGGDLSLPLVVTYSLSGTASNGVDFTYLPGVIEIPSGSTFALIQVEALADGLAEGFERIWLTLDPSADYSIITTNRVGMNVIDPIEYPPLPPGALRAVALPKALQVSSVPERPIRVYELTGSAAGLPQMTIIGTPNRTVTIEVSVDLVEWKPLGTMKIAKDGVLEFTDPTARKFPRSFYRIVTEQ